MKKADLIREFTKNNYINPARKRNDKLVSVRAGDIHHQMSLSQSLPAVCSALGSTKFENLCNVKRKEIIGPLMGATTTFVYEKLDS